MGLSGHWWINPTTAAQLKLTHAQQNQMETVFRETRVQLIDLSASLEKAQATLDLALAADRPDGARISQQIDRVADARAELEKAHSKMLLRVLLLLTPEQWTALQSR